MKNIKRVPWNKGISTGPMSEETKRKISKALSGKMPKNVVAGWNKGKHLSKEHKKKLSEAKLKNPVRYWKGKHTPTRGKKHWNWKGGITKENEKPRKLVRYAEWRKKVFERDNYTCQKCGKRGCTLNAHHIKEWFLFPEKRFDVDNGITLCVDCHKAMPRTWGGNQYKKGNYPNIRNE